MEKIYLDYAATTPVHPEVLKAMQPYFTEQFGNASTLSWLGKAAKSAIENARKIFANAINAKTEEIVFLSGGTEADNFAIKGIAWANQNKGNHIITSAIEHHAILEPCHFLEKQGFKITYLPVDEHGLVSPEDVKKAITDKTILVSIMAANNEIGTIEPISDISKIVKEKDIYFHTDAVQAFAGIPVNVHELGVDLLSVSSHKLYGPKGVGAIYIKKGTKITQLIHGGAHEAHRRAGTENVAGIVGFGKACEIAVQNMNENVSRLTGLRDKFIKEIKAEIKGARLNGHPVNRLPNNINIFFNEADAEGIVIKLDMAGIAVSMGSACSTGAVEPSHVLRAIGLSRQDAAKCVRFTMGKWTTESEINKVIDIVLNIVKDLKGKQLTH